MLGTGIGRNQSKNLTQHGAINHNLWRISSTANVPNNGWHCHRTLLVISQQANANARLNTLRNERSSGSVFEHLHRISPMARPHLDIVFAFSQCHILLLVFHLCNVPSTSQFKWKSMTILINFVTYIFWIHYVNILFL